MSGFSAIKTFDRYSDDSAPPIGTPAATGVWAMRITKFDAGAKIGFAEDNLRNIRALSHYRRKPGPGVEPFEVYISGNLAFEYVTSPLDFDIFDGSLSPQASTDIGANQVVVGPDAVGVAPTGNPVLIAGLDTPGGNVRRVQTDLVGRVFVRLWNQDGNELSRNAGLAVPPGVLQVGGTDGSLLRAFAVDTAGQVLVEGANSVRATYAGGMNGTGIPLIAAGGSLLAIEAPASGVTRIRRIVIEQFSQVQTAAGFVRLLLQRTSAPSTGGGTQVPVPHDSAESAFGGIVRISPATTNVAGILDEFTVWIPAALAQAVGPLVDREYPVSGRKALIIPAGVANGIALLQPNGATGAAGNLSIKIFFTVG